MAGTLLSGFRIKFSVLGLPDDFSPLTEHHVVCVQPFGSAVRSPALWVGLEFGPRGPRQASGGCWAVGACGQAVGLEAPHPLGLSTMFSLVFEGNWLHGVWPQLSVVLMTAY